MKRKWIGVGACALLLLTAACAHKNAQPVAALQPEATVAAAWRLPERLTEIGAGNVKRSVRSAQGEEMLELAAGHQGTLRYSVETTAGNSALADYDLQFLSTQGTAVIRFEALAADGQVLAANDMVFTGTLANGQMDRRYRNNYQGGWIRETLRGSEISKAAARHRLTVEVGQGQHALLRTFRLQPDWQQALKAQLSAPVTTLERGAETVVTADVRNESGRTIDNAELVLQEPYGYGLLIEDGAARQSAAWAAGERRTFQWRLKAQRPDAVNANKAWPLTLTVGGAQLAELRIAVRDERPGRVFYVMTEDLEPIDAAGYPTAWGNQNGWLQPEEYRGQLIGKAEALNRIAEKSDAKWTHYIAWPAIRAAEWAAERSAKNDWRQVVADVKTSVAREAAKGHEYGLHMHGDYDPDLPGNVLSYDPASDGLWANHLKHGWSHLLEREGTLDEPNSRAGMLYRYQRILDELTAGSKQGQLITSRAGSFDFGNGPDSEAASSRAYKAVGLWGSTDSDGNQGGLTSGEYGREIYLAAVNDINQPTSDNKDVGVVEFRPTPRASIGYDNQSAAIMNAKADEGMRKFAAAGVVTPGVHAIIGFTHAMFVMGDDGWKSTSGGQFAELDRHLQYLKTQYADRGLLTFGTAGELVRDYLDYYAPKPVVLYGATINDSWGVARYALQILGRDIPIDAAHPHIVRVKYPLYQRDGAFRIRVLKNGQPIYSTWGLPTAANDVEFTLDDRNAEYALEVWHNEPAAKLIRGVQHWRTRLHL